MRFISTNSWIYLAVLAALSLLGSARTAGAGYLPANLNNSTTTLLGLANDGIDDAPAAQPPGCTAVPTVAPDDSLPAEQRRDGPFASRNLKALLFAMSWGRTNSPRGASGSGIGGQDSGSSGQPIGSTSLIDTVSPRPYGLIRIEKTAFPASPSAARLFRPPRIS